MKLGDIVQRVNVDPRKLTEYALNPQAPRGRHKAIVFERALGFTRENYVDLLTQIERRALETKATFHSEDAFGRRYMVDLTVEGTGGRQGVVRTGWLVPTGADEARLVTLYVRR
jgi:filamentous hemagglutinin